MPRAGLAIRQEAALRAAGEKPCAGCGHPMREHRELRSEFQELVYDDAGTAISMVTRPNPAYQVLHFHCHHDGCDCILDRSKDF